MHTIMKSRYTICIFIAVLTVAVVPFFCYKAIYDPLRVVLNLTEQQPRQGDFWGSFPGPFVEKYNPALRNKTVVKNCIIHDADWMYGPIQHLITLPLTFIKSIKIVSLIWLLSNYCFLAIALFLVLKVLKNLPLWGKVIIIFIWMGYWPLYLGIQEYVIEIFEMLMIILSLYFLYRNKDILSGTAMGIAVMTKFLPAIFLPYFLIKSKFKTLVATLVTIVLIAMGTQVTLGWQHSFTLNAFQEELCYEKQAWTYFRSQTLSSTIGRWFSKLFSGNIFFPECSNSPLAKNIYVIMVIAICAFLCFIMYKGRKRTGYGIEYGICATLMMLLAPHGEPYYLLLNLIGFSFAIAYLCENKYFFGSAILAISYILCGYINQINIFDKLLISQYIVDRHTFFYLLSFPAYGSILLAILLFLIYLRQKSKIPNN